jgi:ATP-binding cassette, subfamily B, bacterial
MTVPLSSWRQLVVLEPARVGTLVGLEATALVLLYLRPLTLGWLIDCALSGAAGAEFTCIAWALGLGLLWLLRQQVSGWKDLALMSASNWLSAQTRHVVVARLQHVPMDVVDGHGAGALAERLERDLAVLDSTALRAPLELTVSWVRVVIGAGLVAWVCPPLLISLGFIAPWVLAALFLVRWTTRSALHVRASAVAQLGSACQEAIGATATIQQAGAGEAVLSRLARHQHDLARVQIRLAWLTSWLPPLLLLLLHAGLGAVLVFGGSSVAAGIMTYGELTACLFLVFLVLGPLQEMVPLSDQYHAASVARQRLQSFLQADATGTHFKTDAEIPRETTLTCTHLGFSYPGRTAVLSQLDAVIAAGERLLICGPSGAGKSTLVQLLSGILAPTCGRVQLGTTDVSQLSEHHLRGRVTTVMQGDRLFAGTIRDNLRLAVPSGLTPSAADDLIHSHARRLGCEAVIQSLPSGYQTPVGGDHESLTLAQRQQLVLLRAVLGSPDVLILDEATSALDGLTAKHLYHAMRGMVRTLVVVDHRPTMTEIADRVMVLGGRS